MFVDGCFWHGCPEHSPDEFRGPNAERWTEKLAANRARDLRAVDAAQGAGWSVLRVWECDVRRDVVGTADRVRRAAVIAGAGDPTDLSTAAAQAPGSGTS